MGFKDSKSCVGLIAQGDCQPRGPGVSGLKTGFQRQKGRFRSKVQDAASCGAAGKCCGPFLSE